MDRQRFLDLPHEIHLKKEMTRYQRPIYFAELPELTGCAAKGGSIAEVAANLKKAKLRWLDSKLSAGLAVPEPVRDTQIMQFNGGFTDQEKEEYYVQQKKPFKTDKKIKYKKHQLSLVPNLA